MSKGAIIFSFLLGAGVGAIAMRVYEEKKLQDKVEEQINEFMAEFLEREKNVSHEEIVEKPVESASNENGMIKNYAKYVKEEKEFVDYTKISKKEESEKSIQIDIPKDKPNPAGTDYHLITESEFGAEDDYTTVTLTYYDNDIVTDEFDEVFENYIEYIGYGFRNQFEHGVAYVRNTRVKIDYEILKADDIYEEGGVSCN